GTNPASAAQCGLTVVTVRSAPDGTVDLEDFTSKLGPNVAAVMLTNPNTLGIFERNIEAMARLAHEAGALLHYDGANLNALVGVARPGDMGFDVVHLNLHKTFSTPHGGGGPGAGPVGVSTQLQDFLPVPRIVRTERGFEWDYQWPHSIGKVRSFYGNFGMLVRAYAYLRAYGDGIAQVACDAVLGARYLRHKLEPWLPVAIETDSFHEFVATPKRSKPPYSELRALDIAKRMIDYGVYPPTVYFPMTVPEAMMFEPTETEAKRSLDELADVVQALMEEGGRGPGRRGQRRSPSGAALATGPEVRVSREDEERQQLLGLMLTRAFRVGDFLLTSGRRSPYYFDGRLVTLDPQGALLVGRALLRFAREDGVTKIGGPTLGADPMVTAVALCSALDEGPDISAFIVRKETKEHGAGGWCAGAAPEPREAVALVDDALTSGGSLLQAAEKVAASGARIVAL